MRELALILTALFTFSAHAGETKVDPAFLKKFDFAPALTPTKAKFLGYVGPNFQRLRIEFDKVAKNANSPAEYSVHGTSQVKKNKCKLSGKITFYANDILLKAKMHYGADGEYKDEGILEEGTLTGDYDITEEGPKTACGSFKGKMNLYWYTDADGAFKYDDIEQDVADGYKNNQYQGSWFARGSDNGKVANWGQYRIPQSQGLDVGAGEFGASEKYLKMGWDD